MAKSKPRAPVEKPDLATRMLFVRVNAALLAKLDAYTEDQNKSVPAGRGRVSRADVVRELLNTALLLWGAR